MGLWEIEVNQKKVSLPWNNLAKSNRKKLFEARRSDARYYLIGGEYPKDNRHDTDRLIILEITDDYKARLLIDTPGYKPGKHIYLDRQAESLRIMKINLEALQMALGFDLGQGEDMPEYDPKTHYVVSREKPGRPRRVLSDEEKQWIRSLRLQGMSINEIAKTVRIRNRLVMEVVKENADD